MLKLLMLSALAQPAADHVALVETSARPAGATSPHVFYQDDEQEELPDKREEIKVLLDELGDHVKERGEKDLEAIAVLDKLMQEFPNSGPKDRKSIVKAIEKCFKVKRTKELQEGVPDDRLYKASAVALRYMAPESVKPLVDLLDFKAADDNLGLRREIILSLGKTQHLDGVDPLTDLLKDDEAGVQAAAAEALGEYGAAPQETRKDIFKELLDIIMGLKSRVDADPTDNISRERYDIIAGPIITSLQLVTGQDIRQPEEWQHWWNKNKKEDWDSEEEG